MVSLASPPTTLSAPPNAPELLRELVPVTVLSLRLSRRSDATENQQIIQPPNGWRRFGQTEGKTYYYHPGDRIILDSKVEHESTWLAIPYWRDRIVSNAATHGLDLTSTSVEMVLHLERKKNVEKCRYYLVDWEGRKEFWCEEVKVKALGMEPVYSADHLGLAILEHFWTHVKYHPMHRVLPPGANLELIEILTYSAISQMTSDTPSAPFSPAHCQRLLDSLTTSPHNGSKETRVIAGLWRTVTHWKFIHFYHRGHFPGRLLHNQPFNPESKPLLSPCLTVFSRIFLFNAPKRHLEILEELWVDRVVYAEQWSVSMKSLQNDWAGLAIMGIFVIIANLSVLDPTRSHSFRLLLSALSTLFALSSVFSSTVMSSRHQWATTFNAAHAGMYLRDTWHPVYGHQPLAIAFALPYACSVWSLVLLVLALLLHRSSLLFLVVFLRVAISGAAWLGILGLSLFWLLVHLRRHGALVGWATQMRRWALRAPGALGD